MSKKLFDPGLLRHRIAIQERLEEQDSETGDILYVWQTVNDERGNWSKVPSAIMPVSAREFEAAAAVQGQTATRFVIRAKDGVIPKMRLVHRGNYYDIGGVLRDTDSGREYMTLSCTQGVNLG